MTSNEALPNAALLLELLALRDRALQAETRNALAFNMANDLYPLLRFQQAMVFAQHGDSLELLSVSGLAKPSEDSPYLIWLQRSSRWLASQLGASEQPLWLAREAVEPPGEIAEGWAEWWPPGVYCVPIHDPQHRRLGLVLVLLDEQPPAVLQHTLTGLWQTWGYCWAALSPRRSFSRWRLHRRHALLAAVLGTAVLLIPVRQTALAPAELVSRQAQIISAPIDGVIDAMHVRPNGSVDIGTPLFSLDETTLRSRAEVLGKEVAVADAELLAASQRAFDNPQSKGELTLLNGRAQQRRAELGAVQAQLKRTRVLAPRAGVAVFSDPDDWLGKPVTTGERILQIADPSQPAMLIELSVADAIALQPGAPVTLFLTAYPLQPLRGHILETSYQARPSDDGVVSYRLLASVEGQPEHAHLGLHGTAKLYGERVLLGYYLLRRPLATLRAWTGW